jgi:uncharacterized protein (DUF1015 family)
MAEVRPFRGLIYNPKIIKNLLDVVSPPFDAVSKDLQKELYERHPYNIVRLESPIEIQGRDKYLEARDTLSKWIDKGVFIPYERDALYFYEKTYEISNTIKTLRGFFAIVKLEPLENRIILPHEFTFSKPKEDRLSLLRATESNISPVLGIYFDETAHMNIWGKLEDYTPIFSGDSFKLWGIVGDIPDAVFRLLSNSIILIADGHHRYETALTYKKEMEVRYKKDGPYTYVMMFLVEAKQGGLSLLPTHRVIKDIPPDFEDRLNDMFYLETQKQLQLDDDEHTLYYYKNDRLYRFHTEELNVISLHKFLDSFRDLVFYYTNSEKEAMNLVDRGDYDVAFLLNPPSMNSIRDIVESGMRLPHKTTYFYPKVGAGFVLYKHNLKEMMV